MSDVLRKNASTGLHEDKMVVKEGRFKKTANLRLKINRTASTVGTSGSSTPTENNITRQKDSFPALEELLQCGICLERLSRPRMLPCQHTFCLNCLKSHLTAKNLRFVSEHSRTNKVLTVDSEVKVMFCPVCQHQVPLKNGFDSLDKLPKNLYLQSLLKVVEDSPVSPKVMTENYRCVNCQMVSTHQEQVCQHCMQIFCSVCWNLHLSELQDNLSVLVTQLSESQNRLRYKHENIRARCQTLHDKVHNATQEKIEAILREEERVLAEVDSIKKEAGITSDIILDGITRLRKDIEVKAQDTTNNQKVLTYVNLHRETSKLLDQVGFFGEARIAFDPDTFKLEQISEGIYNEVGDDQPPHQSGQGYGVANPFENEDSMVKHYRDRSFVPKLVWNKCPRPAGLAIPPWDDNKLYIAATDSHYVLILERSKFKLIDKLDHPDMTCPAGVAFSKDTKEVYVSDKWKHCVHVFTSEGEYTRCLSNLKLRCPDGICTGPNGELVVCDTGNDRVVVVDPVTGDKIKVIGAQNGITQLNFPTSVAVYGQDIIVADSGNNRVKRFNLNGDLLQEIGSFGKNPGQFRSAEVVAVDQLGFILVGDAGNARIQVFKPNGTPIKIFGSKSGFGWVSGLLVTPTLDIITSDHKMRSLKIF